MQANSFHGAAADEKAVVMPKGFSEAVGEWSELAIWMAAGLVGMATSTLMARTPHFKSLLRRFAPRGRTPARRPSRKQSLPMLAEAIIGTSKGTVAGVFGPPRTAADWDLVGGPPCTYWQADTWYYPMPRGGPIAMAIAFDENYARRVDFLHGPR